MYAYRKFIWTFGTCWILHIYPSPSIIITATPCHWLQRAPHPILWSSSPHHPLMSLIFLQSFYRDRYAFGANFWVVFSFDSAFVTALAVLGHSNTTGICNFVGVGFAGNVNQTNVFALIAWRSHVGTKISQKPGIMRNLTHKLSSSDHYSKFCHWFCMPLVKVEVLMDIFSNHGYIDPPRLHHSRCKFWEHSELLVMSALFFLVSGAAFWSCKVLCKISTLEVRKFYYRFLNAMVDMKDEYTLLPCNLTKLNCVSKYYDAVGLPGCVDSMDVVHVKWANYPAGDYNCAKG